ncbi:diguanylate cyclase [Gammaproteobacteria bacterium]
MTGQRSRILVIDDMPANLRTLGAALTGEFDLQFATSGAIGLTLAGQSPPDLILLDVMMPDMDGFETCRQLKADPQLRAIPVVFVTALTDDDSEVAGLALGAADYLTKPVSVEIARHRICNLLEREQLRKEVEAYRDYLEELVEARTQAMTLAQARAANLEGIAYYDPLTGVPNRRLLLDRLSQSIAQAQRSERLLAICYFDLDGFKPVNDHLGHDAGDQLLVEMSSRLQSMLRAGDTLARVGGDEFALLLGNIKQANECCDMLERILASIRAPVIIKNQTVSVSASIGVTLYPLDDAESGSLLRHADEAMYQAKAAGKNRYVVYAADNGMVYQKNDALADMGETLWQERDAIQNVLETVEQAEIALRFQSRRALFLLELPLAAEQLDERGFMQRGLDMAEELTGSKIAYIHFINADQETIEISTCSRNTLTDCMDYSGQHYPISLAGIWADAFRRQVPVVFNDDPNCLDPHGLPAGQAKLTRLISVPVIENGRVVMLTGVGNKTSDYTDLDVETVQLISNAIWRIVQYRRTLGTLRESEQKFRLLAESAIDCIFWITSDGHFQFVSPACETLYGYAAGDFLNDPGLMAKLMHPDDLAVYQAHLHEPQEVDARAMEFRIFARNGELRWVSHQCRAIYDNEGHYLGRRGSNVDITDRKKAESALDHFAYYDPLTGVPNRRLLVDRLSQSLAHAQRTGMLLAVCYLDLDGFKPINDQFGHEAGDHFLVEITSRLQSMLRAGDTLARLGGDEFALLLGTIEEDVECYKVLERVLTVIATPFAINNQSVSVSASIGVTFYPQDDADAGSLLRHADQAMYQAKEAGKNRFYLYDSEQNRKIRLLREERQRLSLALQHQEFVLYYQPKVHLISGVVLGAEALIRWQHPERGLVAPGEFLPLVDGSDLEVPLGEWVIETALSQIAARASTGLALRVSVNISAHHLQQPDFTERLKILLSRYPEVSSDDLELEILESAALGDLKNASQILVDCKKLGVHFSLDDFGTGYSSLSYFRELPVEILKIDQSFVRGMLENPDDRGIVESVIGLARIFKRTVIAEGVESSAHATALIELGCVHGQGYAIARPMPADELPNWVAQWRDKSGLS